MGKSMSLFKSRCLITYGILIPNVFYLFGICNCNRLFLLDINEKYMYVQYVRVLLSAKDSGLAAARFWCWLLVLVELPLPSPHIATNLPKKTGNMRMSNGHISMAFHFVLPLCFCCSAQPTSPAFWAKLRRLTPLGNHLAQLPVDAGCAKLLASQKNLVIFAEFCRTWKLGTMWALWKCLFKNCISVLLFWI